MGILDARGQLVQRGARVDSEVDRAQEKPVKALSGDKTKKIPTSETVKAAKATERKGSSGERQFGAPLAQDNPVSKRDNTVRPEQQHTDNENSSNP